jgi:hypothetical protein
LARYDFCPIPTIHYAALNREIYVYEYYLRNFCDEARFPDWPVGEPLLFSDLALVGAVFRHPQFYLSAVAVWQRVAGGIVAAVLLAVAAWFSRAELAAHLVGLLLLAGGLGALALSLRLPPWRALARVPDAPADTRRLGLLPVLLLYWLRWRAEPDPAPCAPAARQAAEDGPELVIVIQCESFADPAALFGDPALALPGLAAARASHVRGQRCARDDKVLRDVRHPTAAALHALPPADVRLVRERGAPAVSRVRGGVCGGCERNRPAAARGGAAVLLEQPLRVPVPRLDQQLERTSRCRAASSFLQIENSP